MAVITAIRQLPAPAKLNLFLHVTGRRADGYHLLETVFQRIDWCDFLDFAPALDGSIDFALHQGGTHALAPELAGLAPHDNLVVRAATLMRESFSQYPLTRQGVKLSLFKHLPSGAGLGGGSSDAATTMLGLNRFWDINAPLDELKRLGVRLGADVPFFLHGSDAYATGIGEELVSVSLPKLYFVLVHPGISVPTSAIFTHPKLTRDTIPVRISGSLPRFSANGSVLLCGRNDLEAVACDTYPEVALSLQALRLAAQAVTGNDAEVGSVRMTGSGASVFAAFASLEQAQAVEQEVISKLRSSKLSEALGKQKSSNLVVRCCGSWPAVTPGTAI